MLLKGVGLICKDSFGWIFFVSYFYNGGDWIDVVFKYFNVLVVIKCGKFFNILVFYFLCYWLLIVLDDYFFEYRWSDKYGECDFLESKL